ncbi:SusC/RagA family TonB-linked outer membrane protein [Pedobacter glucosidilyticus]|uniref:SusC/RagA family TonB-linked outer membrane protein n=1 Tax=Pedobacter glucosidilyticus TaxID=1122941 RepID=UPI0026EAC221|nr:SusC/RagA family TonB-linked outer membrane protein [Pedobacter glucosidilyticus]
MIINKLNSILLGGILTLTLPAIAQDNKVVTAAQSDTTTQEKKQTFLEYDVNVLFGPSVKRSALSSAISTVKAEDTRSFNTPKFGNTLLGQLSGLYVSAAAGAPGDNDNPGFSIRGRQTFSDNGLVILVDGFETDYNNLLADEIESVSVLKDAGSLSIYGLDGANGIVLITTKRGKVADKNQITFNARAGLQQATVLPNFLGNGDFAELYNIGIVSDGKAISSGLFPSQAIVDYYKSGEYPFLYPDVNWYNEVLKPNTNSQDYSLTFRGGKTNAKYFVALGLADYNGLYANTDKDRLINSNYKFRRYNVRANFDVDITDFLSSEFSLRGTTLDKKYPNVAEADIWRTLGTFNPYPVRTPSGRFGGAQGYRANPVASILQGGFGSLNDRTVDANVKVIGKLNFITPGLKAFAQLNFNNFFYSFYNKTRGFAYEEIIPLPNQAIPGEPIPFNTILRGDNNPNFAFNQPPGTQINRTTFLSGAEYEKVFGNHQVYASAMYLQEKFEFAASQVPFAKQNIMGRLSYNYKSKYFGEFTYAFSGSESFPKGNRFGFFPSIAGGWMLSEENFLKDNKTIDFLKLRGSVGLTGNDRAGNAGRFIYNQFYLRSDTYILGNNLGNDAITFEEGNLANPDVTWEKALKYNIGFDASLYKRLNVAFDYFYEYRKDIFINPANIIPAVIGTDFYNLNRGETENRGFDLTLSYNGKVKNIEYYFGGNASYAKNNIINIEEPLREDAYLYAKGNPINQPYILEAIGFFQDAADIANSPQQLFGRVLPGDVKYKDQNSDGFIDENDRIPVGNTNYPSFWYGFNGGVKLKGFDLNALFQGVAGRDVSIQSAITPILGNIQPTQWVKDNYWTPERGNSAQFPRLTTEINDNNYRASTLWQRSGSFLRLRTLELGYTFPKQLTRKINVNNLRLYISGNNLYTWDNIDEIDVDPEILNPLTHPTLKSYNVGLSLQL